MEKKISVVVEAIVRGARQKLKQVGDSLKGMSTQAKASTAETTRQMGALEKGFAITEAAAKQMALGIISWISYMAVNTLSDLADVAARNMDLAASFENLAKRYGFASRQIVESLEAASKGTIAETDLILGANKLLRQDLDLSIQEYEDLMKIVVVRSREMGISAADGWKLVTQAIESGYPAALRRLGLTIDQEKAEDVYARSLGVTADKLSDAGEQQALVNELLRQGAPDLEDWAELTDSAATSIDRMNAELADAKQHIGEYAAEVKGKAAVETSHLLTILEQLGFIAAMSFRGAQRGIQVFREGIQDGRRDLIALAQEAIKADEAWAHAWGRAMITEPYEAMYAEFGAAINKTAEESVHLADTQDDLARETEKAAKAAERATHIWEDYLHDVAEENYRYAQRVEDAQFRAAQAAEDAAFRLHEIQRDASQAIADLWREYGNTVGDMQREFGLRQYFDQQGQLLSLRNLYQDHLDALHDMEYDFQQDKQELLEDAPWWVRQALKEEFAERERIAATGDKEALKEYDKHLLERIKAIDPAYAAELEKLQERHDHERDIEQREYRQAQQRQRQSFALRMQEQMAFYNERLAQMQRDAQERQQEIERELQDQIEAWEFHNAQRLEEEKRAMDKLLEDHRHKLDEMHHDLQTRLARLPELYKHYGYTSWLAYIEGWKAGIADQPLMLPAPETSTYGTQPGYQHGTPYVPTTGPAWLHAGEMVIPAPTAQAVREGAGGVNITIENLVLGAGVDPMMARQFATRLFDELGTKISQQGRG